MIRREYPDYACKIEALSQALAEIPMYIAFSRKSPRQPQALAAFNRGLAAMQAVGRVAALYQRYILKAPSAR